TLRYEASGTPACFHFGGKGGKRLDDLGNRTIVSREAPALSAQKIVCSETRHVERGSATKPVNGLLGVTDHPEVLAIWPQRGEEAHAAAVHVLIFVHHNVVVLRLQVRA